MVTPTEAHVITFTERLLLQHGLHGWTVKLDNAKKRAGQCTYPVRTISLSRCLIKARPIEHSLDTARHEVAHAIVGPGHGHGKVWRDKLIELGGDGEQFFELDSSSAEKLASMTKYVGICPNNHHSAYSRRPSRKRSCHRCNPSRYDERYLIRIYDRAAFDRGVVVEVGYAPRPQRKVRINLPDGRSFLVPSRF